MVIVNISGGLGNQLFQFSFGRYLAQLLNTNVKYDLQTNRSFKNYTPREIEYALFDSKPEIATKQEIGKMKYFTNGIFERLERKITQKVPFLNTSYFVESPFSGREKTSHFKDNCYYEGYWQSYKYLLNCEISILNEGSITENFSNQNKTLLNNMISDQSIGLHIRRGDYLSNKKNVSIFEMCSSNYYENAIKYFKSSFQNPVFYVFSDDMVWARENFTDTEFKHVTNNKPVIDFLLMSKCKHNIISNSTFSWWAAWLNQNANKTVIAPKLWYKGKRNESTFDLIPENWIRI